MARTHGTAPLPLPATLVSALEERGFRRIPRTGEPDLWRSLRPAGVWVQVVASNIPGDTAVIAGWGDEREGWTERLDPDRLLEVLDRLLDRARGLNTKMGTR